ncbi:hypothetical protein [Aquella oligotrophica]|uniref:hypothetical protein n=1 Tax=Aquella oligotrophica TaxID=2067065 RepID=UPI001315514E|nr:hypothetical protein [Aquella oligotrophica]
MHAQAIETVINDIVSNQELVTKRDLELKLELIKWMIGTGIAEVLAIAGLIKYIH